MTIKYQPLTDALATIKRGLQPTEREQILDALSKWVRQRPVLEYGNYGDPTSYRSELRGITKDLHQAEVLLRYVRPRESITADMLKNAFRNAFSGRLEWQQEAECGGCRLDYCTGQYWPTEYRRAVCAVLASAIWQWWRVQCLPMPDLKHPDGGMGPSTYRGLSAGDYLRRNAQREFGRSIAKRWFS